MSEAFDPWTSEQVITCRDEESGLRAVVAIDDSTLGPGFGGVRFRPYASTEAAVAEAQRLGRAMTYKHALAELPYGGAKSVVIEDSSGVTGPERTRLFERFGEFLARLGGSYIPGVDMGTSLADMATIRAQGAKVYCADHDPSPWTARGAYAALRAGATHALRTDSLDGVRVSVQGVGHVGGVLAVLAARDGADVVVSDVDTDRANAVAETIGGRVVDPADAPFVACDVFAPCAVARVVTAAAVPRLRCRVVAGAANDTLDSPEVARDLLAAGVTFVPDFVANAGGVIHEHARACDWDEDRLAGDVDRIGPRVERILAAADEEGIPPVEAALRMAHERLAAARHSA